MSAYCDVAVIEANTRHAQQNVSLATAITQASSHAATAALLNCRPSAAIDATGAQGGCYNYKAVVAYDGTTFRYVAMSVILFTFLSGSCVLGQMFCTALDIVYS